MGRLEEASKVLLHDTKAYPAGNHPGNQLTATMSKVLLHDTKAYPPPWNQLDALARAYSDRGNVERAIHYYVLALKENPQNEWVKQRLAEMGVKVKDTSQKQRP